MLFVSQYPNLIGGAGSEMIDEVLWMVVPGANLNMIHVD